MPTSLLARILLYTGIGLVLASLIQMRLNGTAVLGGEVMNVLLYLSFVGAAPLLDKAIKNAREDAYLYYLGVSGLRMLLYMGGLGLALFSVPALRDRVMVFTVTVGFLLYTVVEVGTFVRKLREIFRSNT